MKRLIRSGETFSEDELADAELETVPPVTDPDELEQNEPWAVNHGDD